MVEHVAFYFFAKSFLKLVNADVTFAEAGDSMCGTDFFKLFLYLFGVVRIFYLYIYDAGEITVFLKS